MLNQTNLPETPKIASCQDPLFIGIAGPSSAGKSSIAVKLLEMFDNSKAIILGLDSYYKDLPVIPLDDVEEWNFDRPEALDTPLLFKHIKLLSEGKAVDKPNYSYHLHCRISKGIRIEPKKIIIIEGLHSLYWQELRGLYLTSAFITASNEVCLDRKLLRDTRIREHSTEHTINQFETFTKPMYVKYVKPTSMYAELMLNGEDDIEKSTEILYKHVLGKLSRISN